LAQVPQERARPRAEPHCKPRPRPNPSRRSTPLRDAREIRVRAAPRASSAAPPAQHDDAARGRRPLLLLQGSRARGGGRQRERRSGGGAGAPRRRSRAAAPPPLPFDPLRAHRAGRHARPAPPRAAAEADPPGSAEGDSFALPENFCIIESRDAVKDFASLQLDEIADNISARRNRIFLLMEEVRRLRIQQRLKVRRRRSGRWRADAGAAGLEKGWVECHNSRAAAAAV
jgi:hypothetical protein